MHLMRAAALWFFIGALASGAEDWKSQLKTELPLLGHRNWIVVADSAYPAQTAPGITTIYVGGDQIGAVKEVVSLLDAQKHVRARVLLDGELDYIQEADAPGINEYRKRLDDVLQKRAGGHTVETVMHEKLIARLDDAAQTFRVIVLKTDLTIPYTSVFFELDCGYWGPEAEARMRKEISSRAVRP